MGEGGASAGGATRGDPLWGPELEVVAAGWARRGARRADGEMLAAVAWRRTCIGSVTGFDVLDAAG